MAENGGSMRCMPARAVPVGCRNCCGCGLRFGGGRVALEPGADAAGAVSDEQRVGGTQADAAASPQLALRDSASGEHGDRCGHPVDGRTV